MTRARRPDGYRIQETAPSADDGAVLLSVALITRDEGHCIERCLASVAAVADEIVVYDTGSHDGTVEIARRAGARVIQGEWHDDFAQARNAALDACCGRWVLSIDADEWLDEPAIATRRVRERLRDLGDDVTEISLVVLNLTGTNAAPVRPATGSHPVRLFRRERMRWVGRVHEIPESVGAPGERHRWLDVRLVHSGYLAEAWGERGKAERNLRLALMDDPEGARAWFERARRLVVAGRADEAIQGFDTARNAWGADAVTIRSCIEMAGRLRLELGDLEGARRAVADLRILSPHAGVADVLEARVALASGEPHRAIELLDDVTDYQDVFVLTTPAEISMLLAIACVLSQQASRAARAAADAVGGQPNLPDAWLAVALAFSLGASDAPSRAAAELAGDAIVPALGCILALDDAAADAICEALWQRHGARLPLVAAAERLALRLDGDRRAVWATRGSVDHALQNT